MLMPLFETYKTNHDGTYEMSVDEFLGFAQGALTGFDSTHLFAEIATYKQGKKSEVSRKLKAGRIMCSTIHEVCNKKYFKQQLINQILRKGKPPVETDAMQREYRLQNQVIEVVSDKLSAPLHRVGLLLNPEYPVLGAWPSAFGEDFVVEIKCPESEKDFKNYVDSTTKSGLKTKFYDQMQLQMFMKKVKVGYFVVAAPDFEKTKNVTILKVDYNDTFTQKMIKKAKTFWQDEIWPEIYYGKNSPPAKKVEKTRFNKKTGKTFPPTE